MPCFLTSQFRSVCVIHVLTTHPSTTQYSVSALQQLHAADCRSQTILFLLTPPMKMVWPVCRDLTRDSRGISRQYCSWHLLAPSSCVTSVPGADRLTTDVRTLVSVGTLGTGHWAHHHRTPGPGGDTSMDNSGIQLWQVILPDQTQVITMSVSGFRGNCHLNCTHILIMNDIVHILMMCGVWAASQLAKPHSWW